MEPLRIKDDIDKILAKTEENFTEIWQEPRLSFKAKESILSKRGRLGGSEGEMDACL